MFNSFQFLLKIWLRVINMDMDTARELVLTLKQGNKSHAGYGLQKECEALVGHILQNMVKSPLPTLVPETKNEEDSITFREEGNTYFLNIKI